MKTNLLFYLMLLVISTPSFGQKKVFESFDYAIGDINGMGDATDGWSGAWLKNSGIMEVVDGNLGDDMIGTSLKTISGSSQVTYFRELSEKWMDDGSAIWIKFYFQRNTPTADAWGGLSLFNGDAEILFMGCPFGFEFIGFNELPTTVLSTDLSHVTVKLEMEGTTAKDSAYMWINYTGITEPNKAAAMQKTEWGSDGFTKIRIANDQKYSISYDQISLSSTFQLATSAGIIKSSPQLAYIAHDMLRFKGYDSAVNVEVYSILGQKVLSAKNINQINVSNLRNGIYMVRVNGTQAYKVSK